MMVVQVRGKSTKQIRKVFIIIPEFAVKKLQLLANESKSGFIFEKYVLVLIYGIS